eukprot:scaffold20601_cov146-Isochrysis_galbana.AAC.2
MRVPRAFGQRPHGLCAEASLQAQGKDGRRRRTASEARQHAQHRVRSCVVAEAQGRARTRWAWHNVEMPWGEGLVPPDISTDWGVEGALK